MFLYFTFLLLISLISLGILYEIKLSEVKISTIKLFQNKNFVIYPLFRNYVLTYIHIRTNINNIYLYSHKYSHGYVCMWVDYII